MKLSYIVTSAASQLFDVKAKVGAQEVDAKVSGVVIELVSEDGSMGHTFRAMVDDIDAALAEFAVGKKVQVELTALGK